MATAFAEERRNVARIGKRLERAVNKRKRIAPTEVPLQFQNPTLFDQKVRKRSEEFRALMSFYLNIYSEFCQIEMNWRRRIYTGANEFSPKIDRSMRTLHTIWFENTTPFVEDAEKWQRQGLNFDTELTRIKVLREAASNAFYYWESPRISSNPSFRPVTLPEETVERVRELFPGSI